MSDNKNKKEDSTGAARKVIIRTIYAKSQYRKMIVNFWLSLICFAVAFCALFVVLTTPIPPRYLAITPTGSLLQEKPVSDGSAYDDGDILEFSLQAVKKINTYDYINYKYQWQENIDLFTSNGWTKYFEQVAGTQLVNAIQEQKIVSTFILAKPPIITNKLLGADGLYRWIVVLPGTITYYYNGKNSDAGAKNEINANIKLNIVRTGIAENPRGIAVDVYSVLQN